MVTIEQLKQSSDLIKKTRPFYGPILNFYTRVFQEQEACKQNIEINPITIASDLLKIKKKNQLPLIDQSQFLIDLKSSELLFDKTCDLACEFAPELSATASALQKAEQEDRFECKTLFSAVLENNNTFMDELSSLLARPVDELIFFAYSSIAPSIQICAEQLKTYLDPGSETGSGYCPVCGNHPDLAFLDMEGRRHLKCCFCSHEWNVKRMGCVFCNNNDHNLQHYFFNNEEKEYRVYLCDNCHNYIKLVDLRQMNRSFYPKLEQITTLHLDMEAREKGYCVSGTSASCCS